MAKKKVVVKKAVKNSATVSPEEFVTAWSKAASSGKTMSELADELGMKKEAVQARRNNYAQLGLTFPKLARANKGPRIDTEALQKILDKAKVPF